MKNDNSRNNNTHINLNKLIGWSSD